MAVNMVTDRDNGYRNYIRRMRQASVKIDVGVLRPVATMPHPSGRGMTLGTLAAIHEEGRGVPKRAFASEYWRSREAAIDRLTKKAAQRIHEGTSVKTSYNALGRALVDGMRLNMSMVGPPLARSTVSAKGSSTRLQDTGALQRAIGYRID